MDSTSLSSTSSFNTPIGALPHVEGYFQHSNSTPLDMVLGLATIYLIEDA